MPTVAKTPITYIANGQYTSYTFINVAGIIIKAFLNDFISLCRMFNNKLSGVSSVFPLTGIKMKLYIKIKQEWPEICLVQFVTDL